MRWNLDAPTFVPSMFSNLQDNRSNITQPQYSNFAEYYDISSMNPYEFSNYSNDNCFNENTLQSQEDDFVIPQSGYPAEEERLDLSAIFASKHLKPKKKFHGKIFMDIRNVLGSECNAHNINMFINCIAENPIFSCTEKISLMKKLSNCVVNKIKSSFEEIDTFEIIKNCICNRKITLRVDQFINEIVTVKVFTEQQFIEIVKIIIETERFDYVSMGIIFCCFKDSSFNLEILNDLIKFSIEKLRKNLIKNSDKFFEFLEILINNFNMNENSLTIDSFSRFVANDLELYYMGYNLEISFFISCKLFYKNTSNDVKMKFLEVLFYECIGFDKNFTSVEFLERYLYVINSSLIIGVLENNRILGNYECFVKIYERAAENIKFTDEIKDTMVINANNPENIKKFLNEKLKVILNSNFFVIKHTFDHCVKNNFIDIAAKLVEKFNFVHTCEHIKKETVLKIFDARNLDDSEQLIDVKCKFFITKFKYLKFEHLQRYKPEQLSKIFKNFFFNVENHETEAIKLSVHAFVTKFVDPSFIKKYLKSVYESSLEHYIVPMIEDFVEKNTKETDIIVRENNLLTFIHAVISLPISGRSKMAFLNSCKLSKDKEIIFKSLLNNILPVEEALDQLVDILYLDFKFNESVRRTYELLE